MGILSGTLDRLFPGRVFKRELGAAEESSRVLSGMMMGATEICGFRFKSIPLDDEIHFMLGFITSAIDVLVQHLGAAAGRTASMTATLRVYQDLFGQDNALALVSATDDLFAKPTEDFELGRTLGEFYGNAIARQDSDGSALAATLLYTRRYAAYSQTPD